MRENDGRRVAALLLQPDTSAVIRKDKEDNTALWLVSAAIE